jgi:hypothetical protein
MKSLKPDCARGLHRKTPETRAAGFDETLSPVRFEGKTSGIAAIFSDSCSNAASLSLQLRLCGGEGGIRTLGTGISKYNGLAIRYTN